MKDRNINAADPDDALTLKPTIETSDLLDLGTKTASKGKKHGIATQTAGFLSQEEFGVARSNTGTKSIVPPFSIPNNRNKSSK
ncbi:MAG: hypothetical protein WBQ25_16520 [Nitrososphaeraceae archaeon]